MGPEGIIIDSLSMNISVSNIADVSNVSIISNVPNVSNVNALT